MWRKKKDSSKKILTNENKYRIFFYLHIKQMLSLLRFIVKLFSWRWNLNERFLFKRAIVRKAALRYLIVLQLQRRFVVLSNAKKIKQSSEAADHLMFFSQFFFCFFFYSELFKTTKRMWKRSFLVLWTHPKLVLKTVLIVKPYALFIHASLI